MRIKAEVKQEEINGRNRIIVVQVTDNKSGEEYTERVGVPIDAGQEDIQEMVDDIASQYAKGVIIEENIDELKESVADPIGLSSEKDSPENLVEELTSDQSNK